MRITASRRPTPAELAPGHARFDTIAMTDQEFKSRYQLLKKVNEGRVTTYHALAANGAVVMVHRLEASETDEHASLLGLIERLPADERARVLALDDVDGAPLIVTRFLLDFRDLRSWLETTAIAAPTTPALPDRETVAPSSDTPSTPEVAPAAIGPHVDTHRSDTAAAAPSEFTAMFGRPLGVPPTETSAESAAPEAGSGMSAIPPSAPAEGEFTRMFRSPAAETGPPVEATKPRDIFADASPPKADDPGKPLPREVEAPPPSQPKPAGPGEFTRIFGAATTQEPVSGGTQGQAPRPADAPASQGNQPAPPVSPSPPPSMWEAAPTPVTPPPPPVQRPTATGPGEFTRVFGAPERPPAPDPWRLSTGPATPAPASDDYLSRLGATPPPRGPEPRIEAPQAERPAPSEIAWNLDLPKPPPAPRQSEFTRVISSPARPNAAQLPAGVPAAAEAAPPSTAKPPSSKRLVIGLAVIAVIAILAIVLLVVLVR